MRSTLLFGPLLLVAFGCETTPPKPTAEPARVEPSAALEGPRTSTKSYGAPIRGASGTELGTVLTEPARFRGKTVVVEGEVRRACTRKGCWMEIAESLDPSARGARVTFKDYGFFVPTNSAGAHAKLEGVVEVQVLGAAQVEHLEAEGAKFAQKNADGTASEVQFVATGVELTSAL
jgi:hypothetical protein